MATPENYRAPGALECPFITRSFGSKGDCHHCEDPLLWFGFWTRRPRGHLAEPLVIWCNQ